MNTKKTDFFNQSSVYMPAAGYGLFTAGGEHSMKNGTGIKISVTVAAALLAAVLMTLLSAVPPLSYLHDWAESNHMMFLWNGLMAGAIALCLSLYHYHLQR